MKKTQIFLRSKLRFSLKSSKQEFSSIRMRTYMNGKRLTYFLPTDCKIKPEYFDTRTGYAIEDPKRNTALRGDATLQVTMRNINTEIEKTANATLRLIESYKLRGITPNIYQLKVDLRKELKRNVPDESRMEFPDFLAFVNFYIAQCKDGKILSNKGVKIQAGTIKNIASIKHIIRRYCENRHVQLSFNDITLDFYQDFLAFLTTTAHSRGLYKSNAIGKFVKIIKRLMKYAYEHKYTLNDDFKNFKVFNEEVDTIYLNEDELMKLRELQLPNNEAQIRDIFLIGCYTGLRYSDIMQLDPKHIDYEKRTITKITKKTGELVIIPMHQIVRDIFIKHNSHIPHIYSNQATNRTIKNICRQAGITDLVSVKETCGGQRIERTSEKCELVSTHTARRSFATNTYKNGMSTISIMQLTGHRTESSFMRYIRIGKEENALSLLSHSFFKITN